MPAVDPSSEAYWQFDKLCSVDLSMVYTWTAPLVSLPSMISFDDADLADGRVLLRCAFVSFTLPILTVGGDS